MNSILLPICLLLTSISGTPQDDASPRRRETMAVMELLEDGTSPTSRFIGAHLTADLIERVGAEVLTRSLVELRAATQGTELDDMFPEGAHRSCLVYSKRSGAQLVLLIRIAAEKPHRICDLWIEGRAHLDPDVKSEPLPPSLTWDNLAERMKAEAKAGFSGTLLVVKDGKTVMNEAWGLANREKDIATTTETVFAIGSTPIDFTKAAILLLAERDMLGLDQPISDFFDDVPADKEPTTVRHLMKGGSGLQDFLGMPGDADPDHFWIDRDEAVRRILGQTLLFPPGKGREHSHAAWGLLAAIVEIVGEQSYEEFTRENLFAPAGMKDTAFFGDPVAEARSAVGYGELTTGKINTPPNWGRASWLVMGSGGMVSTSGDMLRWMQAMRAGKILSKDSQTRYWSPPGSVLAGGDMFGFEIIYTEGPERMVFLLTNATDGPRRRRFHRLGKELVRLR